MAPDARQNTGRIRHLGNPFRGNEGAGFDRFQSRCRQPIDKFDFGRCGNDRGFVLEAIARSHFDDAHLARQAHDAASNSMSSVPSPTGSPARK